jgi:hypothetical protein
MTVAKFSNDTDAKWIIGLVVLCLILAIGWLMAVGKASKSEESRSESGMVHAPQ